jgi:hypothetical protein
MIFGVCVHDHKITVCDTPPYRHAPTYQISLTYLERQKCYGTDKKILFKNNYLTLRSNVKVQLNYYEIDKWHCWKSYFSCAFLASTKLVLISYYVSPSNEGRHIVLVWFFSSSSSAYLKTIISPWDQRSRSNEGHYGMRHTALSSCTHIPT